MKIRHRYALSIFAVGAVCVGVMIADSAAGTRQLLGERAEARAEALASVVANEIAEPLRDGDDERVRARLRLFSEVKGVERIRIADMNGRATHANSRRIGRPDEDALHRTGREFLAGPNGEARTVEVTISTEGFQKAIVPLLVRGAAWGALSIALLALVSWWLGGRAGEKIERLADAVSNLDRRSEFELPDLADKSELGALARAFRDLHRRLKEEASRRSKLEEQRDDMTNMLVHDLKHPLTIFRMSMAVLGDGPAGPQGREIATALSLAARSTARMEAMIDGVLQTALHDHRPEPPPRKRVPIVDFIRACGEEDSVIARAAKRPWRLDVDPALDGHWILAHRPVLRRLMGNLVLNALDHAPEGTQVTLGARVSAKDSRNVELFVANSASQLQTEPEALLRGKYQGSGENSHAGLGLAFCHAAAKTHSGQLGARLTDDGEVVFFVTMPMGRADSAPAPRIEEEPAHEAAQI